MASRWKTLGVIGLLAPAVALGFAACAREDPPEGLYGNGRIEGNEVRIASKIPGRLTRLTAREGDRVARDEVVAELAADEVEARLRQARAGVEAAKAALVQAETQVSVLRHHLGTARTDLDRMKALLEAGAATAQQVDRAENAVAELEGELEVALARVEQARAVVREQVATVEAARTPLADSRIRSPLDGVVLHRLAEDGEIVQPGQPLLVVVDPQDLFLKVYVAEREIGKLRPGNPVRVTVDAFPDRVFEGVVSQVAEQAEFTPRDVHLPDERTELVFAVKVRLDNREGFLKPGMLADARLLWKQAASAPPLEVAEDRGDQR